MIKLFVFIVITFTKTNQQNVEWIEARPGEFPFMVWLTTKVDTDLSRREKATCVGSLISNEWVIIDAICGILFEQSKDVVLPVESGVIPDRSEGIKVVQKIMHEDFKEYRPGHTNFNLALANSVALLKLSRPVDMLQGFAPLNLATTSLGSDIDALKPTWKNDEAVVVYHKILLHPWSTCQSKYKARDNFYYTKAQGMICSQENQVDVSTAGPFIKKGNSPAEATLIGLLTKHDQKGKSKIYIATDIGLYRNWIKQKTGV